MKIKEILETPRLPQEQEITSPELEESYNGDFENKTNDELVKLSVLLREQAKTLDRESDVLRSRTGDVRRQYKRIQGDSGDLYNGIEPARGLMDDFKDAREAIVSATEGIGVSRTKALEDPRLQRADEVRDYKSKRTRLRNGVLGLREEKGYLKKAVERFGPVPLRGAKRKEALEPKVGVLDQTVQKISGSVEALKLERNHVVNLLAKRAETFWKDKERVEGKDLIIQAAEYGIDAVAQAVAKRALELENEEKKKLGSRTPVPADREESLRSEYLKEIRDILHSDPGYEVLRRVGELDRQETEVSMSLAGLRSQRVGVYSELFKKFKKPLNELPLNIEVHGSKGGPSAYASEGDVVATAWNYEGLTELREAEKKVGEVNDQYNQLKKEIDEEEWQFRNEKSRKPLKWYHLRGELKNKYQRTEEDLKNKNAKLDHLYEELNRLEKEVTDLRAKVKVSKEPVDVLAYVNPQELNNHLYIHENYGRGYAGARAKDPIQTVEDFFTFFYGERQKVLEKIKSEKAKIVSDPFSKAILKLQEQL